MKKFNLVKEQGYFQSLWDTKSVKTTKDENWVEAVEIEWYASTKDKDRVGDIVVPDAFKSALEWYMMNPIVLLQHKAEKPIGVVEEANIDDNWLYIKAKITENTDWVMNQIKNGVLRAFSIWYRVKDYDTDARELADWSYDFTNIIKDLELFEISVVSIPANPFALSKNWYKTRGDLMKLQKLKKKQLKKKLLKLMSKKVKKLHLKKKHEQKMMKI